MYKETNILDKPDKNKRQKTYSEPLINYLVCCTDIEPLAVPSPFIVFSLVSDQRFKILLSLSLP